MSNPSNPGTTPTKTMEPSPEKQPTLPISPLPDFRIPDYPNAALLLNQRPFSIYSLPSPSNDPPSPPDASPEAASHQNIDPAIGLATVLYNWHPTALAAFLDLDAWFSLTWTFSRKAGKEGDGEKGVKFEIGRIANQITFGMLDASGENWEKCASYNINLGLDEKGDEEEEDSKATGNDQDSDTPPTNTDRGKWHPNPKESLRGETEATTTQQVSALATEIIHAMLTNKIWDAPKRSTHTFSVEYAPMDIWGDGIPMDVRWLYRGLDLSACTCCGRGGNDGGLSRCGRCGTATYCGDGCQRADWKVHRVVCKMGLEDRGRAIRMVEAGGLIAWEGVVKEGAGGERSVNPGFEIPQLRRRKK